MNDPLAIIGLREAIELFDGGHILTKARHLEFWIVVAQIVCREARFGIHAPGKQPATKRTINQGRNAIVSAIWKDRFLDAPLEQIVGWLRGVKRSGSAKRVHLFRTEVAHADRPDFAGAIESGHCFGCFPDCRVGVRPMHLVDVDDVRLQTAQGVLDLLDDAGLAGVAVRITILPS